MNDEERADWLARAIDDLLNRDRQRPKEPPPPELERDELNTLMRIAGERIESSQTRLQAGLQYEGEVWQGVLHKLDRRRRPRKAKPRNAIPAEDQFTLEQDLEQFEIDELREIAKMRREMAEQAAAIAEAHRDDVWQRVQARLEPAPGTPQRRRFPFFWHRTEKVEPPAFLRGSAAGERLAAEDRAEMESLLDVANTRRYWSQLTQKAAGERQERVWGAVSRTIVEDKRNKRNKSGKREARASRWPGLAFGAAIVALVVVAVGKRHKREGRGERDEPGSQTAVSAWWPRMAAAGAVLAVVVAALGPLPATGFADHPFLDFGRSVAEHVGVRETDAAPPATGSEEPVVFGGREVTIAEASALLGVLVRVPPAPEGFALRASRFFDAGVTADSGGSYALTYAGPESASVVVYQERASGADFAIPAHPEALEGRSATDVALKDGTPATYVSGAWQPAEGALTWIASAGQTLVFERGGIRTTVQYTGPEASAPSLFALADSMAPAAE